MIPNNFPRQYFHVCPPQTSGEYCFFQSSDRDSKDASCKFNCTSSFPIEQAIRGFKWMCFNVLYDSIVVTDLRSSRCFLSGNLTTRKLYGVFTFWSSLLILFIYFDHSLYHFLALPKFIFWWLVTGTHSFRSLPPRPFRQGEVHQLGAD